MPADSADVEADFTMHLGRSGEAYFVGEDDVVGMTLVCKKVFTTIRSSTAVLVPSYFPYASNVLTATVKHVMCRAAGSKATSHLGSVNMQNNMPML